MPLCAVVFSAVDWVGEIDAYLLCAMVVSLGAQEGTLQRLMLGKHESRGTIIVHLCTGACRFHLKLEEAATYLGRGCLTF